MNISQALDNLKFEIKAILFDWGDTIMKNFPDQSGPMEQWNKIAPVEGVQKTLPLLSQKYKLILVSNADESNRELAKNALSKVDLDKYFYGVYTPYELVCRKPSPEFYNSILTFLDIGPENAIMVGDNYENDIIAAKQAGLFTIWLNTEKRKSNANYPYHDFSIYCFDQIPEIVELNFRNGR